MKRDLRGSLDAWLGDSERRPLVLRGARQVGKTWLVRDLANRCSRDLVELNFEREPGLKRHFASNDPAQILGELSLVLGREIDPARSLLFLDEVQAAGELLAKLRWFYEELPGLPVVAAGSLLEFTLSDHSFSMPVGRIRFLRVEPMSFPEYLEAHERSKLLQVLASWRPGDTLSPAAHEKAEEWFHRYAMVGGMPGIVAADADGRDPKQCRELQRDLVATYRADFARYSGRMDREILDRVLLFAAGSLGRKFVAARVGEGLKHPQVGRALELLETAGLCSVVRHTSANGLPLGAEGNPRFRKVLLLDVGMVQALLSTPAMKRFPVWSSLAPNLRGALADQLAGQQLRLLGDGLGPGSGLYYWQRQGGRPGEIDYVAQVGSDIVPIELKSGSAGSMKSLHQFMFDKHLRLAVRCDANPPSQMQVSLATTQGDPVTYRLVSLPQYLLWNLEAILEERN